MRGPTKDVALSNWEGGQGNGTCHSGMGGTAPGSHSEDGCLAGA